MLIGSNFISRKKYENARKSGVNVFLFNEIDFIPPESTQVRFFNCTKYRVESTWFTWEENEKIILSFKEKFPQMFVLNGYDISLAIKKAMFWSNYKTGFLWYAKNREFSHVKVVDIESLHKYSKQSVILRYLKTRYSNSKKQYSSVINKNHSPSKIIHIKNNFQLGLYENIVNEVEKYHDFKVFIDAKVDRNMLSAINSKNIESIGKKINNYGLPSINLSKMRGNDWFVLNIILLHWNEINDCLHTAEYLLNYNPKVALINEAENGIYGAVVSEVLRKHQTVVYNTMNGIKSGESQDGFINFDKWFIWDEQMKKLLVEKCDLPDEKLIISGHLIEDLVRNYKYQNSLDIDVNALKDKKVISLFSVKGKRFVKLDTLTFLYDFIKNNPNYFLIIRPHPHEMKEDYFLPDFELNNYKIIEYNPYNLNDTLHDQLSISDVSIVFGSTVALDSKWMNVPCISYERREESLIYNIDNSSIFHVKSRMELENKIMELLNQPKPQVPNRKSKVSEIILNEINQTFDAILQS